MKMIAGAIIILAGAISYTGGVSAGLQGKEGAMYGAFLQIIGFIVLIWGIVQETKDRKNKT